MADHQNPEVYVLLLLYVNLLQGLLPLHHLNGTCKFTLALTNTLPETVCTCKASSISIITIFFPIGQQRRMMSPQLQPQSLTTGFAPIQISFFVNSGGNKELICKLLFYHRKPCVLTLHEHVTYNLFTHCFQQPTCKERGRSLAHH